MTITMYANFSKRRNSTLKPETGSGLDVNCTLKEPTNFLNPVIIISPAVLGSTAVAPIYNYVWIPKFFRYYFVDDWTYNGGLWEGTLSVDVMASFKESISGLSCYVERAESAYNGDIIDNMFPATDDYTIQNVSIGCDWAGRTIANGCFIVGIISGENAGGRLGAISYYALTSDELKSLMTFLFSNNIWNSSNITEIGEGLFKSLFNPFQYIVSCMWFPIYINAISTVSKQIQVGYWNTGITAHGVSLYVTGTLSGQATLPDHPQISRGAYLNYAPFSDYTLFLPPFGVIPIDASYRAVSDTLYYSAHIDILTGQSTLRVGFVNNGVAHYFSERTQMLGVPVQLAQILSDYSHSIGMLTNPPSSILGAVINTAGAVVMSAVEAQAPKVSTMGANGSLVNFVMPYGVICKFVHITGASNAILGRPLMETRTISTLSGYIKCRDVFANVPCLGPEKTMIEGIMTGGFYYE